VDNLVLSILLGISISVQLTAAVHAVLNTKLTPNRLPWVLISSAIVLMTVRRIITLTGLINAWETPHTIRWSAEITALLISILMVTGMVLLRRTLLDVSHQISDQKQVFRESLHTSKNNLQSLASLLHTRAAFASSESSRELITELEQKVAVYSLLQQKLFEQESGVDPADYFDEITTTIEAAYSQSARYLPVKRDFDGFRLPHGRATEPRELLYAGLILGEALINAFKYAAAPADPGRGNEIQISVGGGFCRENGCEKDDPARRWVLVADTGPGFPEEVLQGKRAGFGLAFLSGMSCDGWSITWGNDHGAWIRAEF
jgi:two-component sensor histidine kinase